MLQLSTNNLDIIKVSKILAKFKINASTSKTSIILNDGEISEELINALITSGIKINSVRNFIAETSDSLFEDKTLNIDNDKTSSEYIINDGSHRTRIPVNCQEYNLLFPTVKRGEVYLCDFGKPYNCEFGYEHPAVIVQNDELENIHNPLTVVLACSSKHKHFNDFLRQTCQSYSTVFNRPTAILAEHIHTISKLRLRKFFGTLDDETMDKLQPCIDFVVNSNKNVRKIYVEKPTSNFSSTKKK